MSELGNFEEDHQEPRWMPDLVVEDLFWIMEEEEQEEEEAVSLYSSPSSSPSDMFIESLEQVPAVETPSPPQSPQVACPAPHALAALPWSHSEDVRSSNHEEGPTTEGGPQDYADILLQEALHSKMLEMVEFLLLKYREKEQTTRAEMLSSVMKEYHDHFPEIFSAATEVIKLVFGVVVEEVGPSAHTYVMVTALGLTYDGMVSDGNRYPKIGLLITFLWMIASQGDCIPEEKVWEALNVLGVTIGNVHWIYGEPRELITKIWVQEQYVVYRQVPNSDPACFEFLWGPRAHAEATISKVRNFVLLVNNWDPRSLPFLPKGPECNENHFA
ncbi:unnamed protein product [Pipistrellus nathusii]|uniref:MAGE domain-containing protein n=1 Tax=Pipistrellus nathusii TaxID=59473 RepID=A0ABP0AHY1_PIPNA